MAVIPLDCIIVALLQRALTGRLAESHGICGRKEKVREWLIEAGAWNKNAHP
jgi:hypothetical protein